MNNTHITRSPRNKVTGAGFGKGYGRSSSYSRPTHRQLKYVNHRTYDLLR